MTVKLFVFAHLQDLAGFREQELECAAAETARELITRVLPQVPLERVRVAIDGEYRLWDEQIGNAREIALIPPVSGG